MCHASGVPLWTACSPSGVPRCNQNFPWPLEALRPWSPGTLHFQNVATLGTKRVLRGKVLFKQVGLKSVFTCPLDQLNSSLGVRAVHSKWFLCLGDTHQRNSLHSRPKGKALASLHGKTTGQPPRKDEATPARRRVKWEGKETHSLKERSWASGNPVRGLGRVTDCANGIKFCPSLAIQKP